MGDDIAELAERLENYCSERADLRNLTEREREDIARELFIARSQAEPHDSDEWEDDAYRWSMRRKRQRYHEYIGAAGISHSEANRLWWEYVHDGVRASARHKLV